ncbi:MAG: hypothetical protein NC098_07330 [Lachnoclostridium sp.]|nr:hypothetical protein [Lachnoclostridium sp.]
MGETSLWIVAAICYGIVCGGVYTWLSPRRSGSWKMFFTSTIIFAIVGLLIVWLLFKVLK